MESRARKDPLCRMGPVYNRLKRHVDLDYSERTTVWERAFLQRSALSERSIEEGKDNVNLTVFLMGDATACARKGQKTPDG